MSPLRVLIADDDPIIRLDLKQMLEELGYLIVAEAGDGLQAAELAERHRPDVCLFDVRMPALDGIDAAQRLVEEGIAPTVLLTAYSDKELIDRAKQAGVFGYVVKPYKPSDLTPAIEVARSRFEETQALGEEVKSLREKLELRKLLDRAKGVLMERHGIAEPEAYRRIQTQAMNLRKGIKEIAEAILLAESL